MKSMLFVLALVASVNVFANDLFVPSKDLSDDVSDIALDYAVFGKIATKTELRKIPGCEATTERHPSECFERVVIERTPVVTVYVTYNDPTYVDDHHNKQWFAINFRPEEISAEDLAALKRGHRLSRTGARIAKKSFTLQVKRVQRTVEVVDYNLSTICAIGENGQVDPECENDIVYKPGLRWVKEVSVIKK